MKQGRAHRQDSSQYIALLLERYRQLPGTIGHTRAADRDLAEELWKRGVPLELVTTALLLATARRTCRPAQSPTLPLVRSLHYYLPVIEELIETPPDPSYQHYLLGKLHAQLAEESASTTNGENHADEKDPK